MRLASNEVKVTVKAEDKASGPMQRIAKAARGDLSGSMRGLGKTMVGVGAGFIAAQASMAAVQSVMSKSVGAAMSYEAQMAEIRALTGATEQDTNLLTESIMDMAREMPKSPAELGAGAYFILSSGIEDAADAAEVLEVAAKASTVGLGDTNQVADALTTVLNAYGKSAGEAGQVTDVMMEAVKQGKAEAGEFAGVLGRVVPLAAQMGISFEEVAANLATFTRLGVSADEAATGLRQVMASLLKPTQQQEQAMEELGFSAEGLRQQIKEQGLLATLDDMITATGGNEAAVARLFPNIRALTSVLGTAGVQMDAYKDILGATNNATGNLDEGFKIVSSTTKHKVDMAMQNLNLILMDLGQTALPLVAESAEILAQALEPLVLTVEGLNKSLDVLGLELSDIINLRGGLAGLAIAEGFKAAKGALEGADTAAEQLGDSWAAADMAIAGGVAAQVALETSAYGAAAGERDLTAAVNDLAASLMGANAVMQGMAEGFADIAGQRDAETVALDLEINALEQEKNAIDQATVGQESYGGAVESATSAIDDQIRALEQQADALIPEAIEDEIVVLEHEATVLALVSAEIEEQILKKQKLIDTHQDEVDAIELVVDALEDQLKEHESTLKSLDKQIEAEKKLAKERAGTLPHSIRLNQLELAKAKLLQKAKGDVDNLTDAEKAQLGSIERQMDAERRSLEIKELQAEAYELQAEASGEHLEALEEEKAAIEAEMAATEAQIQAKEHLIDTLHPPELLDEIETLKGHKAQVEADKEQVENLKGQRELYIDTLVPPELQQEINKLREQRDLMASLKSKTEGVGGATRGVTTDLEDQIEKLGLEKEAIDLVKEAWVLQGEVIAGLPSLPDILGQLKGYRELIMLDLQKELMKALEAGDIGKVNQIAGWIATLGAMTFAQHGFHGTVTGPHAFFVEPGRTERVDITPGGGGRGGGGNTLQFNFNGPILGDHRQAMQLVEFIRPELERALT